MAANVYRVSRSRVQLTNRVLRYRYQHECGIASEHLLHHLFDANHADPVSWLCTGSPWPRLMKSSRLTASRKVRVATARICSLPNSARHSQPRCLPGAQQQFAVRVQAVALAHGSLEIFDAVDAAVVKTADFQAKAVGPQVHSGKQCSVLHIQAFCSEASIASGRSLFQPGHGCMDQVVSQSAGRPAH